MAYSDHRQKKSLVSLPLDDIVDRLDLVHVKCVLSVSFATQGLDPLPPSQWTQEDFLRKEWKHNNISDSYAKKIQFNSVHQFPGSLSIF